MRLSATTYGFGSNDETATREWASNRHSVPSIRVYSRTLDQPTSLGSRPAVASGCRAGQRRSARLPCQVERRREMVSPADAGGRHLLLNKNAGG
jgi:hypothetical protein